MQKLVTGLLSHLSQEASQHTVRDDDLEQVIDALEKRQQQLRERLAHETRAAQQRHLKVDLEVARLQHRKALALRSDAEPA